MAETKQAPAAPVVEETTALERVNTTLKDYRTNRYNILGPAVIQEIPRDFTVALMLVQINHDPKGREVYKIPGSAELSLGKVALMKIAGAAGISFTWRASGRVDDGSDPNVVRYRAVAHMTDLSGARREMPGEKEINLVAIQHELFANYQRKATEYPQWTKDNGKKVERMLKEEEIDAWVREKVVSDLIQMKKHMLARAQTGAMNRAIALLIGLKMSHTEEDLKRPFVVPSIRFTPDTSDPEVKRFYLALKAGVVEELYGVQRTPLQPLRAVQDARGDIINELTGQVLDEGFEEDGEQKAIGNGGMKPTGGQGQGPAQPAAQTPTGGSAPPAAGHADDLPLFREEGTSQDTPPPNLFEVKWNEAQTREAKEKVLRELLVKKGKKENELNKGNLKSYSDKGLQSIFDHLFKLTDAA